MSELEIEAKVKQIIIDKLTVNAEQVTNEASFQDLGADSLELVELIMQFEDEFGVSIPETESDKIATVGDAIAFIKELQNKEN